MLTASRELYEDECQLKEAIVASLLHSAHAVLSTNASALPLTASALANARRLWTAQAGLDQQRLELGRRRLQNDNEWRKQQREKAAHSDGSASGERRAAGAAHHRSPPEGARRTSAARTRNVDNANKKA